MIGIVMAGGKGSRMETRNEKLLLEFKKPIILHVIDALKNSNCFSKIIAVTSPNSPKTKRLLEQISGLEIFDSPGEGYAADLNRILNTIDDHILVTSGDLAFLDPQIIQQIVSDYNPQNVWTCIVITEGFLESLHLTSDYHISFQGQNCLYTGICLINAKKINGLASVKENYKILDDKRIAFNLNTKQDYELLGTS